MICSICKKGETSVVDSRPTEDGTAIRRRRLCVCGARFTTFERVQFREIMVVKKNGRKSSFDRDKLSKSIYIALKKRPIDTETAESLSNANITCNKNGIPFDSEKPMITSGIRLGTQAATTRGFGLKEFEKVGELITKVVKGLSKNPNDNSKIEEEVRNEVIELTSSFPIYKNLK